MFNYLIYLSVFLLFLRFNYLALIFYLANLIFKKFSFKIFKNHFGVNFIFYNPYKYLIFVNNKKVIQLSKPFHFILLL